MDMHLILAIVLGTAFGFALNRVGATNPNYLINMLRLTNLHLMKVILFAIGLASTLLFAGLTLGLIDPGHISVKGAYLGVLIGGAILGVGFAVAGYCPGTGLAAAATGRKDAVFFTLGGLLGAAAYMLTYTATRELGWLNDLFGGKVTLAVTDSQYEALLPGWSGLLVGGGLGVALMVIALILPARFRKD